MEKCLRIADKIISIIFSKGGKNSIIVSVRGSEETISLLVKKCLDVFFFFFHLGLTIYISNDWRITRTLYKISFLYVRIQFFFVIMKQIFSMSTFGKKLK